MKSELKLDYSFGHSAFCVRYAILSKGQRSSVTRMLLEAPIKKMGEQAAKKDVADCIGTTIEKLAAALSIPERECREMVTRATKMWTGGTVNIPPFTMHIAPEPEKAEPAEKETPQQQSVPHDEVDPDAFRFFDPLSVWQPYPGFHMETGNVFRDIENVTRARIKKEYEALRAAAGVMRGNHTHAVDDVVEWSPKMKNHDVPDYGVPAVVVELVDYTDTKAEKDSPRYREKINGRILYADPKTGEWMEAFVDLRRFRKHLV